MRKVIIISLVVVAIAVVAYFLWKKFGTKVDETVVSDETNTETISNIQLLPVVDTPTQSQEIAVEMN